MTIDVLVPLSYQPDESSPRNARIAFTAERIDRILALPELDATGFCDFPQLLDRPFGVILWLPVCHRILILCISENSAGCGGGVISSLLRGLE